MPKTRAALRAVGKAGTIGVYGPAAVITAALVARRRTVAQALPVLGAVAGGAGASWVLKHLVQRPRPVGVAGPVNDHPSFPSGHATRASAAAFAIAYVLVRERMTRRRVAVPLAATIALAVGVSRTYADAHWTTDVVGGWAVGAAAGAAGALWYERKRR
jgi:undecaprenyl-diphosphatase